jgi:DNA-binding Lrp family transcriptional regulator
MSNFETQVWHGPACEGLTLALTAFAFVGLTSQAEPDLKAFEEQVRQWQIVRECYMMSGEVDFVLKCVAHDLGEWQSFVTQTLTAARSVASVKTALTIRESKREPGVPVELAPGSAASNA